MATENKTSTTRSSAKAAAKKAPRKPAAKKAAAKRTTTTPTRRVTTQPTGGESSADQTDTGDTGDIGDVADHDGASGDWDRWGPGLGGRQMPDLPDLGDVGEFIRQQREKMEMSVRRLSELAGVSNPYLSQIERGLRNPSADILQQVANALRISVESLYVRAGILPDQNRSVSTVPEAIEHDRELSPEQKLALLNVYQSFTTR